MIVAGKSLEEFIHIWQSSASLDEAADRLGLSRGYSSTCATRVRRAMLAMGIHDEDPSILKRFAGGRPAKPLTTDQIERLKKISQEANK
jgi:hypothetical protein